MTSYAVEALRSAPTPPDQLPWDPAVSIEYADLDGIKVRYIRTGSGPNVVLLHTLRTQLDIFHKIIPELARHFTVYAYDYPPAGGIRQSSLMARLILGPSGVPILGETLMRLRNRFVSDRIMEGGVASADALSPWKSTRTAFTLRQLRSLYIGVRQRVMKDVAALSLETELFGEPMPVALAPIGLGGSVAPR